MLTTIIVLAAIAQIALNAVVLTPRKLLPEKWRGLVDSPRKFLASYWKAEE